MGKNRRRGTTAGKRKSKGKKQIIKDSYGADAEDDGDQLLADEITALSAIFQDDFSIVSDQPVKELKINLRLHSDYDTDFTAQLFVRCPAEYPWRPPKLQIVTSDKSLEAESRTLHAMLVDQAASLSREGRVMLFNLVEAAQEYFSECLANVAHHHKKESEESELKILESTVINDSSSSEYSDADVFYCDLWGEHETWEVHDRGHLHLENESPSNEQNKTRLIKARPPALVLPDLQKLPEIRKLRDTAIPAPESSEEDEEDDNTAELSSTTSVTEFLQKVRSGVFRMGRAVKHSVFPERSSEAITESTQDEAVLSIQKDLILAYLLRLVCGKRGPLPDTLPIFASELLKLGMMPSWAEELVARQPQLFQATFKRIFGHNVDRGDASGSRKTLESFWNASPVLLGENGSFGAITSRYSSDFEELCLLGKGGFGHVVLCKNKLDGRRYAIKKIRLKDENPSDKILREVATLSRLQHQHVVRYYQAWCETALGGLTVAGNKEFEDSSDWTETCSTFNNENENGSTTILYIQMEYCPRTLREVFDTSPTLDKDSAWGIFRQIVEGLAHIHGQGIIHRDLTPNNIFFDARNDVKIGDFGLAKFANLENPDRDIVLTNETNKSIEGTGQVGTYFYRAPEVEQAWPHIDEKVDMYSLGIILFELWHPFSTGMERHIILNELKQNNSLPSAWVTKFPQQAALVKLLISPHFHERPSAWEVLQSELLPPRMEDEALKDVLRAIQSAENSSVFDQVIATIFDEERLAIKADNMERVPRDMDFHSIKWLKAQERVVDLAKEVFTCHGAHYFQSSSMDLVTDHKRLNRSAVRVMNSSGSMLELRYDTRRPFAEWIVSNQCTTWKRYEISHSYRKGAGHRAPKEYLQGDFDIVGGCCPLAEAEAIKVAVEIVSKLPSIETYEIRLNHCELLNAIWNWSGVTKQQRKKVAQILGTMTLPCPQSFDRKARWVFVRRQLVQGLQLPEAVVDRLQTAERRYTGNAEEVLARLKGVLKSDEASNAIEELSKLLSCLRTWHVEKLVMVDLFMVPAEYCFDGINFQVYLPKGSPGNYSQGMLVAVGGRYDSLIEQFSKGYRFTSTTGAVGLTIALQKLGYIAAEDRNAQGTEVLVCSRGGGGMLEERMEIVDELWAANLKADFVCEYAPSLTEQYEYAHENGIKWLVIITESGLSQSGTVKVRHLDLKVEVEVPREDLPKVLTEMVSSGPLNLKKNQRHSS